jgi:putative ABC transport system substrate-binding protein
MVDRHTARLRPRSVAAVRSIRRREFITLLGTAAAAWPLAARAQQVGGMRRLGWLIAGAENDLGGRATRTALQEALAKLGWIEGRNLRIDLRFGAGDPVRIRAYAAELVGLAPDVMVTGSGAPTIALQQQTQTIPIVFTGGADAVAAGLVRNIARPEGNITGFSSREPSIAGKCLELLKEAAPRVTKVALVFNPEMLVPLIVPFYIASIEAAAPTLGLEAIKTPVRNAVNIVHAIDAFAAEPNGGLLVLPPTPTTAIRDTILQMAAQHRLPAIYTNQADAAAGGLLAYANDPVDQSRRAATYVDRLLRGAKVSELPVQFPTKFQLVVNLKTAKAIGLTIPEAFLLRADEVIE